MKVGRLLTAVATLACIATTAWAQTPSGPLVTGEWLEKNVNDPKVRIVEVSVEPGLFERARPCHQSVNLSIATHWEVPTFLGAFAHQTSGKNSKLLS